MLLALPGCSTAEDPPALISISTSPGLQVGNGTIAPLLLQNATTDTLHLLEPPALGMSPANRTIAIAKGQMPQGFAWNATIRGVAVVTGADLVVWLRFTGSQVQAGANDPGCTVVATLTFTINGTATQVPAGCGSAGVGILTPGDVQLRFGPQPGAFATPLYVGPGDDVRLDLVIHTESPSVAPTCFILSDAEHDSRLRLVGLNETTTPW